MINLFQKFTGIHEYFSPQVIGEVNDVYIKLAKIKGNDIPWHNHEQEDELFYIIKGQLLFETEGQDAFAMNEGDMHIVRMGVNHRVSSKEECWIMLIENKSTKHTGNVNSPISKAIDDQIKK